MKTWLLSHDQGKKKKKRKKEKKKKKLTQSFSRDLHYVPTVPVPAYQLGRARRRTLLSGIAISMSSGRPHDDDDTRTPFIPLKPLHSPSPNGNTGATSILNRLAPSHHHHHGGGGGPPIYRRRPFILLALLTVLLTTVLLVTWKREPIQAFLDPANRSGH
jgi:hypothetical protein